MIHEIVGPLDWSPYKYAERWSTSLRRAEDDECSNARIAAACAISGEEYPGQAAAHAWNAVAAYRKGWEHIVDRTEQ